MRKHDLTGQRFGRLTVLRPAPRTYQTMWWCRCVCGTELAISAVNLKTEHSTSCGCYREEQRRTYAQRRDYTGAKNPRAKKSAAIAGVHVPSSSVWYKRAAGIFYSARKRGIKMGFPNVAALAAYVQQHAPDKCPVFGRRFMQRAEGFHPWAPSIDKKDPRKGYVPGNIQVISMRANAMKRDASPAELVRFAQWVLENT